MWFGCSICAWLSLSVPHDPSFSFFLSLSLSLFYRVYKIFKSKQLTRAVYSDIWVLSRVFAAVSITLIIILIEIETVGWGSSRHTISSEEETSIKFFQTFTITRCAIAIICLFFFFLTKTRAHANWERLVRKWSNASVLITHFFRFLTEPYTLLTARGMVRIISFWESRLPLSFPTCFWHFRCGTSTKLLATLVRFSLLHSKFCLSGSYPSSYTSICFPYFLF